MNDEVCINFALDHIMEKSTVFNELDRMLEELFNKYEIPKWLTKSQVRMVSEILSSGNKTMILERLDGYRKLQLKRESQKDKWKRKEDTKIAIDAFYDMVKEMPDTNIISLIEYEMSDLNIQFNPEPYTNLIYQTLIHKFNYLFVMKCIIQKKETNNV